jgi:hypothetical protein
VVALSLSLRFDLHLNISLVDPRGTHRGGPVSVGGEGAAR